MAHPYKRISTLGPAIVADALKTAEAEMSGEDRWEIAAEATDHALAELAGYGWLAQLATLDAVTDFYGPENIDIHHEQVTDYATLRDATDAYHVLNSAIQTRQKGTYARGPETITVEVTDDPLDTFDGMVDAVESRIEGVDDPFERGLAFETAYDTVYEARLRELPFIAHANLIDEVTRAYGVDVTGDTAEREDLYTYEDWREGFLCAFSWLLLMMCAERELDRRGLPVE